MNTLSVVFVASTVVAGFAFGLAMLWVTAEWLKSEGESEEVEAKVQETLGAPGGWPATVAETRSPGP